MASRMYLLPLGTAAALALIYCWPHYRLSATKHPSATCVDIVVPVRDTLDELKDMLASVGAFTQLHYNIHLVDDRSCANTSLWLQEFKATSTINVSLYHLKEPYVGYAYAVNAGIVGGHCPYVVVANTDIIVTQGWLDSMLACMHRFPKSGMVGPLSNAASYQSVPLIKEPDSHTKSLEWSKNKLLDGWTPEGVSLAVRHVSARAYPVVPFLNGFCILFKRKVFDDIGLLDIDNFQYGYGDENDLALRAAKAGFWAVVDDSTYVYHHKTRSFSQQERKMQSEHGRIMLLRKHSKAVVQAAERTMIDKMKADVSATRKRLQSALKFPELFQESSMRVLFLLFSSRPGGGSTSVIREAQEMKRVGVTVRIALWDSSLPLFTSVYPEDPDLFIPWPKSNPDRLAVKALRSYATLFHIVVATVWASAYEVLEMRKISPTFIPAYYVQDYEADFYPHAHKYDDKRARATQSYRKITDAGGFIYTKSRWLANKVLSVGGGKAYVVPAAIEDLKCQSLAAARKQNSSISIVAMIRPATPRRNAEYTYDTLRSIKLAYGHGVNIITFGCELSDAPFMSKADFGFLHMGILDRSEVDSLFAQTDIFLDLSIWQAYGRSAAEAMTCGNTAIVTQVGGAREFIKHGYNGYLINATDPTGVLLAVGELVKSRERLKVMQRRARAILGQLRIHTAVAQRLQLFGKKLKERDQAHIA